MTAEEIKKNKEKLIRELYRAISSLDDYSNNADAPNLDSRIEAINEAIKIIEDKK